MTTVGELKPSERTPVDVPAGFPWLAVTPPYPHQVEFSAWRRGHGRERYQGQPVLHPVAACEAGLGTGKTLMGLEEVLKIRKAQGGRCKALALVPKDIMLTTWATEIPKHAPGLPFLMLDGPTRKRRADLARFTDGLVVHCTESYAQMADALNAIAWDLVIIDEYQDFRNPESERAKALLGRGRFNANRRRNPGVGPLRGRTKIINSASPVIKGATNVYVPYKWLAGCWGTAASFRTNYVVMGGYGGNQEVAIRNPAQLRTILDRYRYVVPADEVLGLEDPVFHYRAVELPPWQWALYVKVQEELRTEVDGDQARIATQLTKLLRLAQVASGFEAIDVDRYAWRDDNAKAMNLFDRVLPQVFDQEDRAIVWGIYRPELRELARMARERGYRPVVFQGIGQGYSQANKVKAFHDFKAGRANLFIGQMASGGRGLNLGESRTMVFYSRSFDTEKYIQALGRDRRMDSVKGVRNRIILQAVTPPEGETPGIDFHIDQVLRGDLTTAALLSSVKLAEVIGVPGNSNRRR